MTHENPYFYQKSRFAPSPTGYLHRGHLLSAAWVWGIAQWTGATTLLRIEDHDVSRSREEYAASIFEDLSYFGFVWDECSRQRDREEIYLSALGLLKGFAEIYACDCSRKHILSLSPFSDQEPCYKGTCRYRGLPFKTGNSIRVHLSERCISWSDLRLGAFTDSPYQQCGDLMIKDSLGQWTYQFAVSVDDLDEGIDLVVRGMDLLDSTARQIQLAQMLGRAQPPAFLHHPLLRGSDGMKLSKRQLSKSLRAERAQGISAAQMLGEVCTQGGLLDTFRPLQVVELGELVQKAMKTATQW